MAWPQPPASIFLLLVLISPTFALSQNDSIQIALGVSLGVVLVLIMGITTFIVLRYRERKNRNKSLGTTLHPRFGDPSIKAPGKGWSHLSPLRGNFASPIRAAFHSPIRAAFHSPIRAQYPPNIRNQKPVKDKTLLDPEAGEVADLPDLKELNISPSLSSSSTAPSPSAPAYSRHTPPMETRVVTLPSHPAPNHPDKPFVLATDFSAKRSSKRYASPAPPRSRRPSPHTPHDQDPPTDVSKTFDLAALPKDNTRDPNPHSQKDQESLTIATPPQPQVHAPAEPHEKSSTILPTRRNASASPARGPIPAGPVVYKPVSESYMADLSRMGTLQQNHYGHGSHAVSKRSSAYRHRSTSRGSRTRSVERSHSTEPAFPRHPAHERHPSDTSTVYEAEAGDEQVSEDLKGYGSDYENRGRWGLKGKKEAVAEEDLYG